MKKGIKNFFAGLIIGAAITGTLGAFAGQYVATENPFPVQLNGNNVSIEGYNIDGSTYFKLRDISDIVGGFYVGFDNDTIQLAKDGYSYNSDKTQAFSVIESDGNTYYILNDDPSYITGINAGGKAFVRAYKDTYGNQYVSLSDVGSICARTGLFCSLFPTKTGIWEFKEYNDSTESFEYISSGDLFVNKSIEDFYMFLDDYTGKIAPTLDPLIEKYYR